MIGNYIAIYFINVVSLVILCCLIHSNNMLDQSRKWPFYCGAYLTILMILSEAGTIMTDGRADLRALSILCNVLGFSLAPIIPIVLIAIFDAKIIRAKNLFLIIPSVLNALTAVLSPRHSYIFFVDAANRYERGRFFYIFVAVYTINLIILLFYTLRTVEQHHYPIKAKLLALTFFAMAGTSIQLIFPAVYATWHCITLALMLYYLLLSEFDASLDTLTRLHNRAAFEKTVKKLRDKKSFSIVVLDINHFKDINDNYGHDFGDQVLKTIASVVRKSLDNRSKCFRMGGDEIYIINNETDPPKLEQQLRRMTANLEQERRSESRLPTVAYGYSFFTVNKSPDFQTVLKEADDQMYYFKKLQKDQEKGTLTALQ